MDLPEHSPASTAGISAVVEPVGPGPLGEHALHLLDALSMPAGSNLSMLSAIVEGTSDSVFVKDLAGRFLLVNDACARAIGRRAGEVIGKTNAELHDTEVADTLVQQDNEVVTAGVTMTFEHAYEVDGATVTMLVTKSPYRDSNGRIVGVIGVSKNISDRRVVEEEQRAEARRLSDIIRLQRAITMAAHESTPVAAEIALHVDGLTGALGCAIGRHDGERVVVESASGCLVDGLDLRPMLAATQHREVAREDQLAHWPPAGHPELVSAAAVPLREGALTNGVLLIVSDRPGAFTDADIQALQLIGGLLSTAISRVSAFTENRRLFEDRGTVLKALKSSEESLRDSISAGHLGLWEWRMSDGAFLGAGQYATILGREPGDIERFDQFLDGIHEEDRPGFELAMNAALVDREPFTYEYRVRRADGSISWVGIQGRFSYDEQGAPIRLRGAILDVSDQKLAHQQLMQSQKIEAIGQLAAGIAHEINTPAQYVSDNLHFLQQSLVEVGTVVEAMEHLRAAVRGTGVATAALEALDAAIEVVDVPYLRREMPRAAQQAVEGVDRVTEIVRAMKDFAHPGETARTQVDVNSALENTCIVSRNEWKYVADLVTDFEPDLPPVPCHPGELQQVFLNLIINAAQAIGGTGAGNPGAKGTITISTLRRDEWVEVRVTDTGPGIPEAIRARIFEPFFTTKPAGKGTGQGLSLARDIVVKRHGGLLSFETAIGVGTTFVVRMPFQPGAASLK
ncbi:MAG: ATP-binding protein [Gemmatimonadota bacterium]